MYHDECDCPVADLTSWYEAMECPASYEQLERDLSQWSEPIDMKKVAQEAVQKFSNRGRHSLCHYVVKDNKVHVTRVHR